MFIPFYSQSFIFCTEFKELLFAKVQRFGLKLYYFHCLILFISDAKLGNQLGIKKKQQLIYMIKPPAATLGVPIFLLLPLYFLRVIYQARCPSSDGSKVRV